MVHFSLGEVYRYYRNHQGCKSNFTDEDVYLNIKIWHFKTYWGETVPISECLILNLKRIMISLHVDFYRVCGQFSQLHNANVNINEYYLKSEVSSESRWIFTIILIHKYAHAKTLTVPEQIPFYKMYPTVIFKDEAFYPEKEPKISHFLLQPWCGINRFSSIMVELCTCSCIYTN